MRVWEKTLTACVVVTLAAASLAWAQDPCDRLLRQWIDELEAGRLGEGQINQPLVRLADLRSAYGVPSIQAVDWVFQAAEPGGVGRAMEQLLEKLTPEQANRVFSSAAGFADQQARRGVIRAAGMNPFLDIEPGTSIHNFLQKTVIPSGAKQQFFRSLDVVAAHEGTARLLKRAGEANDYGAVFELAADAKLADTGRYGNLVSVDFDESGANTAFHLVDTRAEIPGGTKYVLQSKSSYNQSRSLVLDSDISVEDLDDLVEQAGRLGSQPVLMSNVGFDQPLIDACEARNIIMEPNWVRVAE